MIIREFGENITCNRQKHAAPSPNWNKEDDDIGCSNKMLFEHEQALQTEIILLLFAASKSTKYSFFASYLVALIISVLEKRVYVGVKILLPPPLRYRYHQTQLI